MTVYQVMKVRMILITNRENTLRQLYNLQEQVNIEDFSSFSRKFYASIVGESYWNIH